MPVYHDVADENGFSKRVVHIVKENFVSCKAVYFDRDGELHKELNLKDEYFTTRYLERF